MSAHGSLRAGESDAVPCVRRRLDAAAEPRRPPHPLTKLEGEGGHEDRADDERVQQDAEGDRDPDLGERDEREHGEHRERPGEHDPGGRDHASRDGETCEHRPASRRAQRLLAYAGHEEDVVVDAERDQEDEREEREARILSREVGEELEQHEARAECGKVREHDRRHQQHRRNDGPQQRDENHEDDREHEGDEELRVTRVAARRSASSAVGPPTSATPSVAARSSSRSVATAA